MNKTQREAWQRWVLKEVLAALMADEALRDVLVFKGAWVLNLQLGEDRHSEDIDATTFPECDGRLSDLASLKEHLENHLSRAIRRHFERQNPVRLTLKQDVIRQAPAAGHPRGWDMLKIRLTIEDKEHTLVRNLPPAEIEIAAPEKLGEHSTEVLDFLGARARVYTLHRIAGEKLRAFLTSLPEYRAKMGGGARTTRVKDLYDLARILHHRPIDQHTFWTLAMREFRLACESRYVDCEGPETFKQEWEAARQRYEQNVHLQGISFGDAEAALEVIAKWLDQEKVFPLRYPLESVPEA